MMRLVGEDIWTDDKLSIRWDKIGSSDVRGDNAEISKSKEEDDP